MAHEIAKKEDGSAAMIYAGATPWHRLGTTIPEESTRDLDWAIREAGLGFRVEKHRAAALVPDENGIEVGVGRFRVVPSEDIFSVVRSDTQAILGSVGQTWAPLQNEDAFAPLRPMLEAGMATVETGGVLRDGKQVWMLVRFDQEQIMRVAQDKKIAAAAKRSQLEDTLQNEVGGGILPYGLFTNDHSGRGKARIKETAIRVVCANTLDWSLGESEIGFGVSVRHVAGVKENYEEATAKMVRSLVLRYVGLAEARGILRSVRITDAQFDKAVLDTAIPVAHLEERIARHEGTAFTETSLRKKSEARDEVRRLWMEGAGQQGDATGWDAYNGLVEWVDHSEQAVTASTDRVQSLIDGTLGKVKNRVFANLMTLAQD